MLNKFFENPSFPAAIETQVAAEQENLTQYLLRVKEIYKARLVYAEDNEIVVFTRPESQEVGVWYGADMIFKAPSGIRYPPKGKTVWASSRGEAESGGSPKGSGDGRRVWAITAAGEILSPDESPEKGHPNHNGVPMWLALMLADGYAV